GRDHPAPLSPAGRCSGRKHGFVTVRSPTRVHFAVTLVAGGGWTFNPHPGGDAREHVKVAAGARERYAPRRSATVSSRARISTASSPTSSSRGSCESDSSPKTRSNSGVVR